MLLRSTSSPVLKLSEAADLGPRISPTRPTSFMCLQRTLSEDNLVLKRSPSFRHRNIFAKSTLSPRKVNEEMNVCMETALSLVDGGGGGGGKGAGAVAAEEKMVSLGAGGAGSFRGGGKRGRSGGGDGSGQGPDKSESVDVYYQNMVQRYPGNALLLANYAKYLKEVRGDVVKAEEFFERAIVANGCDGNVLCMYGDMIWDNHKDGDRAQRYFDKAVQTSPHDCYVLASYARFLWETEEEEVEDEKEDGCEHRSIETRAPLHNLSQGFTPLAAAY
ncbi:hypothetical protein Tsubulata_018137 [Turnera subulata]|uniref:Suppressor of forked domain-containing protein n=1 Tax=Turnera subulata TaxID=218843 RepID=A0A9Q0JF23_9ROSI|nr:hypothetical protein Tsubulata_018137 [Turnera subulata]